MGIHWPQIVIICILAMNMGMAIANHGAPKGNWSLWASLFDTALFTGILWAGGFFT